jgi:hypothetical protein
MTTELAVVQPARGTAAQWTLANPLLLLGQEGYEDDTTKVKRGDGVTLWNDLPYWTGAQGLQGIPGTPGIQGIQGIPGTPGGSGSGGSGNITDRGAWSGAGVAYNVHDMYEYGGSTWLVATAYTSTTTFDPTKAVELDSFRGAWAASTEYNAGDSAIASGAIYERNATGVSATTWTADAANWTQIGGAGVSSFNTRTGAVALTKADVIGTGVAAADFGAEPSGTASAAITALGLGTAATQPVTAFDAAGTSAAETARAQGIEATKAPTASPTLTGTPSAPTPVAGDSTAKISTTQFVANAIAALVNNAPGTLDTLGQIAAELAGDEGTAGALATTVGTKAPLNAIFAGLGNPATLTASASLVANTRQTVSNAASTTAAAFALPAPSVLGRIIVIEREDDGTLGTAAAISVNGSIRGANGSLNLTLLDESIVLLDSGATWLPFSGYKTLASLTAYNDARYTLPGASGPGQLPVAVPTVASPGAALVAQGASVVPAQVGINLTTPVLPSDIGAAAATDLTAHTTNVANPHATTAAQVGINSSMLTALTSIAAGTYSGSSGGGGLASGLLYGDGSDGVVTFDGAATFAFATLSGSVYTLLRDVNLAGGSVINSGVQVEMACSRIYCTGQLTNNGTISANGVSATGQAAQAYTLATGNLFSLAKPGAGGAGGSHTNGSAGGAGAGAGAGGTGGLTSTYTVGAAGASLAINLPHTSNLSLGSVMATGVWTSFGRGGGGGGGCGDNTNNGGAGGTGAGLILIIAQTLINNGALQAIGGNGGPGAAGNASGGGGGGGGQIVVLSAAAITGTGTTTCAGGTGGAKFTGGTGNNGAAGANGPGLLNVVLPLDSVTGNPFSWVYGDGSDGTVVFDGTTANAFSTLSGSTYTLTRDCFLASGSVINSGVTVVVGGFNTTLANPQAFRMFCKGTLTNNGTISNNGANGSQTSAYLGSAAQQGTVAGPSRGGPGASGAGTPYYVQSGSWGGGSGGGGGKGTSAASQANATGGNVTNGVVNMIPRGAQAILGVSMDAGSWTMFGQGGSGGGGTADGTNIAGSGGQGGGIVLIASVAFVNNGVVQALGGTGGSPTTGACGAGGGGGGGMVLFVTAGPVTGTGSTNTAGGIGGTGTNTAAGHGQITINTVSSTTDGNNGTAGGVLNVLVA